MKSYESPAINSVENLVFETVCAGSGGACPYGKTKPNPNYIGSECASCLTANVPAYEVFKKTWNNPTGITQEEYLAANFMINNPGVCPAGLSFP